MIGHVLTKTTSSPLSRRSCCRSRLLSNSTSTSNSTITTRDPPPQSWVWVCGRTFFLEQRSRFGPNPRRKTTTTRTAATPLPRGGYSTSSSWHAPVLPAVVVPRPPMPRIHPRVLLFNKNDPFHPSPSSPRISSTPAPTSTTTGFFGRCTAWWNQDGSLLIAVGWMGLALLTIDQGLQYSDRQQARETIQALANEQRQTRKHLFQLHAYRPTLYESVVRRQYRMGGTHGLAGNVKIGDIVQVLQEGVGPGQQYALCRRTDSTGTIQVGWYPTGFLERKEEKIQQATAE